ncbi:hypothetical protein JM93_01901 [Roseibium hamelinense]|uniref:Uncharacterized protein n=1 Tax=Roseibium hamelinense TaxID=150831 RepID=A0A562T7U2_9HYPH|nr:hypothetical protein [Roseibium hamelinense]TWI89695.1 hypothetical protein JM93_01901 [Roseibium hamelinense]
MHLTSAGLLCIACAVVMTLFIDTEHLTQRSDLSGNAAPHYHAPLAN